MQKFGVTFALMVVILSQSSEREINLLVLPVLEILMTSCTVGYKKWLTEIAKYVFVRVGLLTGFPLEQMQLFWNFKIMRMNLLRRRLTVQIDNQQRIQETPEFYLTQLRANYRIS